MTSRYYCGNTTKHKYCMSVLFNIIMYSNVGMKLLILRIKWDIYVEYYRFQEKLFYF